MEILAPLRFLMAVSVIGTHMWRSGFGDAGLHAVVGFYAISGFLITRISLGTYRGRPAAFLFNRFLRIYPQYAAAISLGALIAWRMPEVARHFNGALRLPTNLLEWAKQIFIFGLYVSPVRLSPPTWSLNVEIYFYLLIGLLTHRSERATYAALFISAALGVWAALGHAPFSFYGDPLGNAFVFFLGSSACFLSRRITPPHWLGWAMLILYALFAYGASRWFRADTPGSDALLATSALILAVMLIRPPQIAPADPRLANFLGRVSYPLFLVHWASTTPVFARIGHQGPALFCGGLAASLLVASLLVWGIDRPIEHFRRQVRVSG